MLTAENDVLAEGEQESEFNPFDHRKVSHPTTDSDTLMHLLKGAIGLGVPAMPMAFMNAGLWFGLVATVLLGSISTYCVHILVKCAHILSRRTQIHTLAYADIPEMAFLSGPAHLRKWSRAVRIISNTFLVVDMLGTCCVYIIFVATNLKQVVNYNWGLDWNIRIYIALLGVPLLVLNMVKRLKYLTPISMVANILLAVGMGITMYYVCIDLPHVSSRPSIAEIQRLPIFFGTVIFASSGIGVAMSLENNMKHPNHFIGCPGVLNIGMIIVISVYAFVGFLGYLKFGDETADSITLNLPLNKLLAESAKMMIALAIFLTYALTFYVPIEIIWKKVQHNFNDHNAAEYGVRACLVALTVVIAIALPNLGPFISLIGAFCLSMLALIIPAVVETVTYWERPGFGKYNWRIWKNAVLVAFGVIGFLTGTYVSIMEMYTHQV